MELRDVLHRTCVIIPLSNGVTVCCARGSSALCAGYFQHVVLYTIVKYSVQYGWKKIFEQRVYCKIRAQLGFPPTEIHADLQNVYGNGALKYATVCKWVRRFNDGRVPHLLTDEQKQSRVRLASQVIEKYDNCDTRRLEEIVTGDETWIYNFQPHSKAKDEVWVSSEGDRPVIARRCKTSNRILYAIFFYSKGPVLQIPFPKGSSVTGKFYRESVFTQVVDFYQKRRPRTGVGGIKLFHDNAPAHKSTTVQKYLKESGLDVLHHPPYSPDLSPSDFWLFQRLKEMLAGHRFESRCGIGSAVYQCLQHIPKECYWAAFRKWVDRCMQADRAYFEGLR